MHTRTSSESRYTATRGVFAKLSMVVLEIIEHFFTPALPYLRLVRLSVLEMNFVCFGLFCPLSLSLFRSLLSFSIFLTHCGFLPVKPAVSFVVGTNLLSSALFAHGTKANSLTESAT